MYRFVGSCSCCYGNKGEKMKFTSLIPLPPSAQNDISEKRAGRVPHKQREPELFVKTLIPTIKGCIVNPGKTNKKHS